MPFLNRRKWEAILIVAFLGVFVLIYPAQADLMDTTAGILSAIAQVIISLVSQILVALIQILLAVTQYNDFINAPAVIKGWVLVRDVSNLAFLVIFIGIAFATILGVEKYEYKRLLPKLLIMAVLINFSRTICGLILDAAQVLMMTFVNGFKDVAAGNLIRGFGLEDMLTLRDQPGGPPPDVTPNTLAAASLLAVVMLIIATITVGVIVAMFLIRIIYLWILVLLSPLAFMLSAAPGLSGKFDEWWGKLIKYAFVGPIMAFFLWLSFSIMASVPAGGTLAGENNLSTGTYDERTHATITRIGGSDQLLSYGIAIALLLLSLTIASEMGVKGGKLAEAAIGRIRSGAGGLAKFAGLSVLTGGLGPALGAAVGYKGGKWLGAKGYGLAKEKLPGVIKQRIQDFSTAEGAGRFRRALKYTTKEGWEGFFERGKQKQRWAAEKARGAAREDADQVFTGVKQIPHAEIAEHKIEQELIREYEQFDKERFMKFAEEIMKVGGQEGQRMRKSVVLGAANKGYLDDLMSQPIFRDKYAKLGAEKYGYEDGTFYNDVLLNEFLYDFLEGSQEAGAGRESASQDTMRVMDDLEDLGRRTNHWEYLGHSNYNTKTGEYEATQFSARANEENLAVDVNDNVITDQQGRKIKTKDRDGKDTLRYDRAKKAWLAKDENDQDIELQGEVLQQMRWLNQDQQNFGIGEMQKLGARDKGRAAPHNFVSLRYDAANDNILREGAFTEFHRGALGAMGGEVSREVQHTQARLKEWFFGAAGVDDNGAVSSPTMENLEKIMTLNAFNPTVVKNMFRLLCNDDKQTQGFAVELKDQKENIIGERLFGDKNTVRNFQKERLVDNMQAVVPEIEEALARGDQGPLNHLRDMFYQYVKVHKGGQVDPNILASDIEVAAKRLQATIDGVFSQIFKSNGEIADPAKYAALQVTAVNPQQITSLIQVAFTDLEKRFAALGTGMLPPTPAAQAAPTPPAGGAAVGTSPAPGATAPTAGASPAGGGTTTPTGAGAGATTGGGATAGTPGPTPPTAGTPTP